VSPGDLVFMNESEKWARCTVNEESTIELLDKLSLVMGEPVIVLRLFDATWGKNPDMSYTWAEVLTRHGVCVIRADAFNEAR